MKTEQIQEMRALLAAQASVSETRAPSFPRTLKTLLAPRRPSPPTTPLCFQTRTTIPQPETTMESEDGDALLLRDDVFRSSDDPKPCGTIPPQVLLGCLAPRRPAFGQRTEPVLELKESAPAELHRLTLMAANGAAVGEIILHAADRAPAADPKHRRPFERLHSETPFFPEDLADEPRSRSVQKRAAAPPLAPELAATFLLATLAARLAKEEAQLRRRLSAATSSAAA